MQMKAIIFECIQDILFIINKFELAFFNCAKDDAAFHTSSEAYLI